MVTTLLNATRETCGGKAATLGTLLREGFPVPDGFVVPFTADRAGSALRNEVADGLAAMGDPPVAVRSSAAREDTADASAAGQYESFLAVRGTDDVADAIMACWESTTSARAAGYWSRVGGDGTPAEPGVAVLVQRLVDADVSGVMFTPGRSGEPTRIEASWGLGPAVVGGTVTPDAYEVRADGTVVRFPGRKTTRLDRGPDGLAARDIPVHEQDSPALDDPTAAHLAALGGRVATLLGGSQDIEWALADGTIWIVQSRPVTAPLPALRPTDRTALSGTPGAHGVVTGAARIVRGPGDFGRVRPGDIVICPYTDPAWTPLFAIAAGVVTETGGALSHAAIVAREYGIPAALGVRDVMTRIRDGARITLDGTSGTLTPH